MLDTNHKPIIKTFCKAAKSKGKLIQWALKLQGKWYQIEYVIGCANAAVDYFSCALVEALGGLVDEIL